MLINALSLSVDLSKFDCLLIFLVVKIVIYIGFCCQYFFSGTPLNLANDVLFVKAVK